MAEVIKHKCLLALPLCLVPPHGVSAIRFWTLSSSFVFLPTGSLFGVVFVRLFRGFFGLGVLWLSASAVSGCSRSTDDSIFGSLKKVRSSLRTHATMVAYEAFLRKFLTIICAPHMGHAHFS